MKVNFRRSFRKKTLNIFIVLFSLMLSQKAFSENIEISEYGPVSDAQNNFTDSFTQNESLISPAQETSVASVNETDSVPQNHQEINPLQESALAETKSQNQQEDAGQNLTGNSLFSFKRSENTKTPDVESKFAVLVNSDTGEIIAGKNESDKFYPASMTKVMTLLTALKYMSDPEEKLTFTEETVERAKSLGLSRAGFKAGESVSFNDVLMGLILPSGGDCAMMISEKIGGSEENFAYLMNSLAKEYGLTDTNFKNSTGIYDDDHYSTPLEIAMIMKQASLNPQAMEVLSKRNYTTEKTEYHKNGIYLTNLFLKRIDSQDTGGSVLLAKTGYVKMAGNCAVSFMKGQSGANYICVTGKCQGPWTAVSDHAKLYKEYCR